MIKPIYYDHIHKCYFENNFKEIGRNLDEALASRKNLVLREEAAMDAIFGVHNLIIIRRVIISFIPTVGIDVNPTDDKRNKILEQRQAWTSHYDKKKYLYLKSTI